MRKKRLTGIPAIVLAGGRTSPEFAAAAGVEPVEGARALVEIDGIPMIEHVVRALLDATRVSRIVLVAPAHFPSVFGVDLQLESGEGIVESLQRGMSHCQGSVFALVVTGDVPFLTGDAIDDYISRCSELELDCGYSTVSQESCEAQFPGMRRTYLKTPNGQFSGGNVVYQRVDAFADQAAFLREAYRRRKNPLFLARMIGFSGILRFLTGQLTLSDVGAAASRLTGVRCRMVVTPYACIGTDVDRPEDLAMARETLRRSRAA